MTHCLFVCRPPASGRTRRLLTYEIVGLSDVVVPHGHLQGLFGEVCIFYVVTELLQKTQEQKVSSCLQSEAD